MTQAMTGAATDATAEIENSIRMALEAAEAANDSATCPSSNDLEQAA